MEADFRLRIETEAKREFFIDCHVDRLDEAAGAAVVCDYKTGTPDLTLSEIAAGYRLQLITYLMAVLESGDQSLLPGALLYIYLRGETRTVPVPAGGAPAEPQKQLAGYFLSDRDFLAALDSRVGTDHPARGIHEGRRFHRPLPRAHPGRNAGPLRHDEAAPRRPL